MKSDMGEEITGFRQVAKSYVACFKGVNRVGGSSILQIWQDHISIFKTSVLS